MTTKEFLGQMERYYGLAYDKSGEGPVVARYLSTKTDRWRAELAAVTIMRHSRKWKTLPDVAIFEECAPDVRARLHASNSAPALPEPDGDDRREEIAVFLRDLVTKLNVRGQT